MFVDGSSCVSKDEVVCLSCDFVDFKSEVSVFEMFLQI